MLTASSKSWAFSPSMVTEGQSRKSRRPAKASGRTSDGMASASRTASSGNSDLSP